MKPDDPILALLNMRLNPHVRDMTPEEMQAERKRLKEMVEGKPTEKVALQRTEASDVHEDSNDQIKSEEDFLPRFVRRVAKSIGCYSLASETERLDRARILCNEGYRHKYADNALAVKWFKKAISLGSVRAQWSLGVMYFDGLGVTQSYEKALEYFKLAADQGDADGLVNLGFMFDFGHGLPRDRTKAYDLYFKAACKGSKDALYNLGSLCLECDGFSKNLVEAWAWFSIHAGRPSLEEENYKSSQSVNDLAEIEKHLTQDQKIEAQNLAIKLATTVLRN